MPAEGYLMLLAGVPLIVVAVVYLLCPNIGDWR